MFFVKTDFLKKNISKKIFFHFFSNKTECVGCYIGVTDKNSG